MVDISLKFILTCACIISVQSTNSNSLRDLPYVTSLTVNGKGGLGPHFIPRNHSVNIVCSWGNGNPPVTVHLLDRNDNILHSRNVTGDIRYTLPPDSCNSTGILKCSAAGSKNNMSTLLALECPPLFDKNSVLKIRAKYGKHLHIKISVIAHTLSINNCWFDNVNDNNVTSYQCKILNNSVSSFTSKNKKCRCVMTGVVPNLTLAVTLHNITDIDDGKWYLNLSNEIGNSGLDVLITVRDIPARVTSLTFNRHDGSIQNLVPINQTVLVVCTWEHVYPPATIRLINKDDNVLPSYNDKNGKMTLEIPLVSCNDAGTFRCEASGSSRNLSATLLVQCPPEFDDTTKEITAVIGRLLSLAFPVRVHTAQITECEITKYSLDVGKNRDEVFVSSNRTCSIINQGHVEDQLYKTMPSKDVKKCKCSVKGTAPNLTFKLDVYGIAVEDTGHWRINLANHEGQGHAHFFLIVIKDENGNSDRGSAKAAAPIVIIFITFISIIIIIVTIIIILFKKEMMSRKMFMLRRQVKTFHSEERAKMNVTHTSRHISHIYWDITEIPKCTGTSSAERIVSSDNKETDDHDYSPIIHTDLQTTMSISDVKEEYSALGPDDDFSIHSETGSEITSVKTEYLTPVTVLSQDESAAVHLTHDESIPCLQIPTDQLTSAESDSVESEEQLQYTNRHVVIEPSENVIQQCPKVT